MTLGKKLKELRKKFGLTQEELGRMMNVSRQAITKWENDNGIPDISNLVLLANYFEISVDYLLDEKRKLPFLSLHISLDKKKTIAFYKTLPVNEKLLVEFIYEFKHGDNCGHQIWLTPVPAYLTITNTNHDLIIY